MAIKSMIVVEITKRFEDIVVDLLKIKKLVTDVCSRFGLSQATVSITIVGNAEIHELNVKFLNHDYPTDCLSFDLSTDNDSPNKVFDIIVNAEKAIEQAQLRGHSSQAELALYITHGLLHNLGFNDADQPRAQEMHKTEDEILSEFGLGFVYNHSKNAEL